MTRRTASIRINYGRGTCPCCEKRVALTDELLIVAHTNKRGRGQQCIGRNMTPINPSKPIKSFVK